MLGPLPFVTMRKQKHDAARPLPFALRTGDKLIDDHLRTVGKITELRLPLTEHLGVVQRIPVIESQHCGFAQQRVVNAQLRLIGRDVLKREKAFAGLLVVHHRVALAEGPAAAILSAQTNRRSFEQKASPRERFGK